MSVYFLILSCVKSENEPPPPSFSLSVAFCGFTSTSLLDPGTIPSSPNLPELFS